MARAAPFDASDRLPWLNDPPPAAVQRRSLGVPILVGAALAGAAGAAAWTVVQRAIAPGEAVSRSSPADTVALPPPVEARPVQAEPVSAREALTPQAPPPAHLSAPAPPPAIRAPAAKPARKPARRKIAVRKAAPKAASSAQSAPVAARAPVAASPAYDPRAWNSGVRGRIIQLGAYRTPAQAHGQWNRVYYRYPLLRPLPPRVVKTRIRGRTYYRMQLGTFSHAHSEMLCQRLRAVGEGCIVLGLKRGRRR